jgi:hypothetical protein
MSRNRPLLPQGHTPEENLNETARRLRAACVADPTLGVRALARAAGCSPATASRWTRDPRFRRALVRIDGGRSLAALPGIMDQLVRKAQAPSLSPETQALVDRLVRAAEPSN